MQAFITMSTYDNILYFYHFDRIILKYIFVFARRSKRLNILIHPYLYGVRNPHRHEQKMTKTVIKLQSGTIIYQSFYHEYQTCSVRITDISNDDESENIKEKYTLNLAQYKLAFFKNQKNFKTS